MKHDINTLCVYGTAVNIERFYIHYSTEFASNYKYYTFALSNTFIAK